MRTQKAHKLQKKNQTGQKWHSRMGLVTHFLDACNNGWMINYM